MLESMGLQSDMIEHANAGDMGSILAPRFYMLWGNQACKPQLLKPTCSRSQVLQQEKPPQWAAHAPQEEYRAEEEPLLTATRESPCAATKNQRSQKKKKKKSLKKW